MKRVLYLIGLLTCSAIVTYGQATVSLSPVASQQFFSTTGVPLASGCLYTYISGTSTPQATYTDGTGVSVNPNPVILNGGGFGNLWLTNTTYRYTLYSKGLGGVLGSDCFSGTFQYTIDNVSAYTIINQAQNLFLTCASSDPSGSAGELGCRSDLSNKLRYFTTLWDSVVTETGTATLLNKTLTSPTITGTDSGTEIQVNKTLTSPVLNSPTINGQTIGAISTASNNPTNFTSITNDTVTGTTLNTLTKTKALGSGTTAIISTAGDIGGVEGVTIAGAGTSSVNIIQKSGEVLCVFDGSTTVLDYVQISGSVNGNCHDTGSTTYPTSGGQVIGRARTTNAGVGTYLIDLFGPEIRPAAGTAAKVDLTAQGANIVSTPLITPSANGFYRISCYLVVTQAATVSSTLPSCQVLWTDADSSVSETITLTSTTSANTLGAIATPGSAGLFPFQSKTGVAISYQTTGYATNGATPMQYAIHLRLEGPF